MYGDLIVDESTGNSGQGPPASLLPELSPDDLGGLAHSAIKKVTMPSDAWQVHNKAKRDSDVGRILRSAYNISVARPTWVLLTSLPYMETLLSRGYYVTAVHRTDPVRRKRKQPSSQRRALTANQTPTFEYVEHGPRFDVDTDGVQRLSFPVIAPHEEGVLSLELKLSNKDQNHGVLRSDEKLTDSVFMRKLYRNDVAGIVKYIKWWRHMWSWYQDHSSWYERVHGIPYNGQDKHPNLYEASPKFWIGSNGGGACLASEKGCPPLDSVAAHRNAPDRYVAGGRLPTPENRALDCLMYRRACFKVYLALDPWLWHTSNS